MTRSLTRSDLVILAVATAGLVIGTIFVANPQNQTRVFNLALTGRCPDGSMAPDGELEYCPQKKPKPAAQTPTDGNQATPPPTTGNPESRPAKSAKDCRNNEVFYEGKCYPVGYKFKDGATVCKDAKYGGAPYICMDKDNNNVNDASQPPPQQGQTGFKGCTFTGAGGQTFNITEGQSVSGSEAYNFNGQRIAVYACHNGQLVQCTAALIQQYPNLGNCTKSTIQPSYSATAKTGNSASCNYSGLLLASGQPLLTQNQTGQTVISVCKNGAVSATNTNFQDLANYYVSTNPGADATAAMTGFCISQGGQNCADPTQFVFDFINQIDPDTAAGLAGQRQENLTWQAYAQYRAKLNQTPAAAPPAGPVPATDPKLECQKTCLSSRNSQGEQISRSCILDALGNYKCVDASISYNSTSLGTIKPVGTIPQNPLGQPLNNPVAPAAPVACGGSLQPCCQTGFGSLITYNSNAPKAACNTGLACKNGRCQYDQALSQATAISNLIGQTMKANGGKIESTTYQAIIANNAQTMPEAVSRLNEANKDKQATCAGAWTYSDETKNYVCINPKQEDVPIDPNFPDKGNLGQPCRPTTLGLFGGKCNNDDMLTCQNGGCVLTESGKHTIAANQSSQNPETVAFNLATINSPGQKIALDPKNSESGCTQSQSVYQQNGQTWICWDAGNKIISLAPSRDYLTDKNLQASLFANLKLTTAPTVARGAGGKGALTSPTCPGGMVLLNNICVDETVAAFDEAYSQGSFASALKENEFINQIPIIGFAVDHILAPIITALSPSYYNAAKIQAETAYEMLENSDASLEQIKRTISPNAQVLLTTQNSTVWQWHNDKNIGANVSEIASEATYHALAGLSLFTSAWTEGGLTGPEQSSFLNYATGYSQAEGGYWDKFINPQAIGGAAGFGTEITFVIADFLPAAWVENASKALVVPHALQTAFEKTAVSKFGTGLLEIATSPFLLLTPTNIKPLEIAAHGWDLIKQAVNPTTVRTVTDDTIENLAYFALKEAGEVSPAEAKKILLDNGVAAEKVDELLGFFAKDPGVKITGLDQPGSFTDLLDNAAAPPAPKATDNLLEFTSPNGVTKTINPETLEVTVTGGSLWAKAKDAAANLLPRNYDDNIAAAAKALTDLAEGKPTGWLNNAAKIKDLVANGIPVEKITKDMLDELDSAILAAVEKIKPKITYTIDEMLARGADPHILDNGHYLETDGIQTIKTSEISSINSQLATDATDQGLTVNDIRELIRKDEFSWNIDEKNTFLPYSNKDPIVAYELPDGTYHIEAGRHRAEALIRENIEDMEVRLWQLDKVSQKIDIPSAPPPPAAGGNWFSNNIYNSQNGLFPKLTAKSKALTIGFTIGAAGTAGTWVADQLDLLDPLIDAVKNLFNSIFNPQPEPPAPPTNSQPQAPTNLPPVRTQEPSNQTKPQSPTQPKKLFTLFSQGDPEIKDYVIAYFNGIPRTMNNIGCGPVAVANILNQLGISDADPVEIAQNIDPEYWGYEGITLFNDSPILEALSENGVTADPYSNAFSLIDDYSEPGDLILVNGIIDTNGQSVGHITYLQTNGQNNFSLQDNFFGENMTCVLAGSNQLSCSNGQNNYLTIDLENRPVYILEYNP